MSANLSVASHDVLQHVDFLRQALDGDRRPIALMLGAGCPLAVSVEPDKPLIPAIDGMTASVNRALAQDDSYQLVLNCLKDDGYEKPSVERILSCVRKLHDAAGVGEVRGLSADALDAVEKSISKEVVALVDVDLPLAHNAYTGLASWIQSRRRESPVEIFTTNYDLLAEQALERFRLPFFDGFAGSCRAFFDPTSIAMNDLPGRWTRLWKLHGSANWRQEAHGVIRLSELQRDGSALIHPSHLKYDESRKMPYRAFVDRLEYFLRQPGAVLVSAGYSFSDHHLNEAIRQGLEFNPSAAVFGLLHGALDQYSAGVGLAESRSNLSLFAESSAVVGCRTSPWELRSSPAGVAASAVQEVDGKAKFSAGDFAILTEFLNGMVQ
jgi:hypothetical protein